MPVVNSSDNSVGTGHRAKLEIFQAATTKNSVTEGTDVRWSSGQALFDQSVNGSI